MLLQRWTVFIGLAGVFVSYVIFCFTPIVPEKMVTAWTNFAKYSDPQGDWKPCTAEDPGFMVFRLDENDNEASFFGEPLSPSRP